MLVSCLNTSFCGIYFLSLVHYTSQKAALTQECRHQLVKHFGSFDMRAMSASIKYIYLAARSTTRFLCVGNRYNTVLTTPYQKSFIIESSQCLTQVYMLLITAKSGICSCQQCLPCAWLQT